MLSIWGYADSYTLEQAAMLMADMNPSSAGSLVKAESEGLKGWENAKTWFEVLGSAIRSGTLHTQSGFVSATVTLNQLEQDLVYVKPEELTDQHVPHLLTARVASEELAGWMKDKGLEFDFISQHLFALDTEVSPSVITQQKRTITGLEKQLAALEEQRGTGTGKTETQLLRYKQIAGLLLRSFATTSYIYGSENKPNINAIAELMELNLPDDSYGLSNRSLRKRMSEALLTVPERK